MRISQILTAFVLAVFGLSTHAQNISEVNFANVNNLEQWGTAKRESYDVAVRLVDASFIGSQIKGVEIPIVVAEGTSNWSVWISKELNIVDRKNTPDVLSVNCVPQEGKVKVTFEEPYKVPEEGLYVGYSFEITETLNDNLKYPITVGDGNDENGFFVHTSRTYMKWQHPSSDKAVNMIVYLEGNFEKDKISISSIPDYGELHGKQLKPVVNIRNVGTNDVASIKYECQINGETYSGSKDFSPALTPGFDKDVALTLELDAIAEAGTYPLTFEITEVNRNASTGIAKDGNVYVYPYLPERHPLMEDYTGTWCGWCPKAFISMDGMKKIYGDKYIGIVYHIDDILTISPNPYIENSGIPGAYLDRGPYLDPYYGSLTEKEQSTCTTYKNGILLDWERQYDKYTTADLNVECEWASDEKEQIKIDSKVKFVRPYDSASFAMMYILVSEELTNPGISAWNQENYYSGGSKYVGTDLEELSKQPALIRDIVFHDVVIMAPDTYGIEGSLPSDIPYLTELSHSKTFNLSDVKTTPPAHLQNIKVDLVQNKEKLYVVGAVINRETGEIFNARKVRIKDNFSAIDDIYCDSDLNIDEWYTLQGVLVDSKNMAPGIYIHRNGEKVTKVMIR